MVNDDKISKRLRLKEKWQTNKYLRPNCKIRLKR